MFAATAAYAEPTVNKGDNAWMLTSTVLVLLMTIPGPGAVLWRSRPLQEHALGADAGVLHRLHRHRCSGSLYGYSLAFTGGSDFIGGFSKAFLIGRDPGHEGGDLQRRRQHLRAGLHLLPDDVRVHHPCPHRRRLRRAHEVLGDRAVRSALGHADLLPDGAHGLVLGGSGRCSQRRCQGARRGG